MSVLTDIVSDLREKRLWPVALVLLAALVAVPVVLGRPSRPMAPVQPGAPLSAAAPGATALPAVSVSSAAEHANLNGPARDPFTQQSLSAAKSHPARKSASNAAKASTGKATAKSSTTAASTAGGGGGATGGSSGSTPGSTPAPTIPIEPSEPAPSGLSETEAYSVAFAITNAAGGFDTTDPLERLSVLPSQRRPLLVELGVLKGGRRVLFAVEPGTVLQGPGACTPGPVDCEILSLAPGQTEQLSEQSLVGVTNVGLFAVTEIRADRYPSPAAAARARRVESAAGRRLLRSSSLGALALFRYQPGLGAIVDLRNVSVGGN